jgi:hypothetical protein
MAVAAATANTNGRLDINSLEEELNKLEGISVAKDGEDGQLPWTVTGNGMQFQIKEGGTIEEINGIILSKELLKMVEGQSPVTITATLTYGVQGTITWTSSNESIATVNNGTITLVGTSGTADITATVSGTEYSATCKVTVVPNVTNAIVDSDASVEIGETLDITTIITNIDSIEEFTIASVTGNAEKINDTTIKGTGTEDGTATVTIKGTSSERTKVLTIAVKKPIQPAVGDFVNYSAGNWTKEDLIKLGVTYNADGTIESNGDLYSGKSLPTSSTPFKFGGFEEGDSKDDSITPYSTYANTYSSGWRILNIKTDENGVTYYEIIHAGTPEGYYHPYSTNSSYKSLYILDGTETKDSDGNTYWTYSSISKRDWSMYANGTYANSARSVTYDEMYNITGSTSSTSNTLRKTGSYYWLPRANFSTLLGYVRDDGRTSDSASECFGVRPVVTLKSEVKLTANPGDTTHTTKATAWNLSIEN